jgi:early secretory antigenic target protein ESAT-6
MSSRIEAEPENMRTVADELGTAAAGLQGELDTLGVTLDILAGSWSGAAADAYQEAQRGWGTSMAEIRSVLQTASSLLSSAASRYETTEQSVVMECT